jgi:hypothetical protein
MMLFNRYFNPLFVVVRDLDLVRFEPDVARRVVCDKSSLFEAVDEVLASSCVVVRIEESNAKRSNAESNASIAASLSLRLTAQCWRRLTFRLGIRYPVMMSFRAIDSLELGGGESHSVTLPR